MLDVMGALCEKKFLLVVILINLKRRNKGSIRTACESGDLLGDMTLGISH